MTTTETDKKVTRRKAANSKQKVKTRGIRKMTKRKVRAPWRQLPYIALVKVMENLNDHQRVKTAQVCQSWKNAFENPALWREKHFEFGGSKINASGQNALNFARTKGAYLQKVSINCRHITSNTCESITNTLEEFASHIASARLEELRVSGLELDRFWKYAHLRGNVTDCLCQLLREKRHLKVFEMTVSQFGLLPGTEVLHTISQASSQTLATLLLEDFFHSRLAAFELSTFRDALQSFSNLQVVALNYSSMYDELVKYWASSLKGKLKSLQIKACDNEPHAHTISDASWKALASACPALSVEMSIVGIGPSSSVVPLLPKETPLTSLHMWSGYDNDQTLQLSDTLNHIATNHGTKLQSLDLDFDNYQDDIDDALVRVVACCRNLKHLRVKANSSVRVANAVCQIVRDRQTRLTNVDIMLCDMSDPDIERLRELREEMETVAQERGVTLVLQNDLY